MATYYISPAGNDSTGNGSYASPWLTLNKCNTSASDNDIIILKNGTYAVTSFNVALTKGFDIRAETNNLAIVDGGGTACFQMTLITSKTLIFTGIIFRNFLTTTNNPPFWFYGAGQTITATWKNCTFLDIILATSAFSQYNALVAQAGSANFTPIYTFEYCLFKNITRNSATAGTNMHIVCLYSYITLQSRIFINNCSIYNSNTTYGLTSAFRGFGNNVTIVPKNTNMYSAVSTQFAESYVSCIATYCVLYQVTGYTDGGNNLTSDPLFVDPASNNFNLQQTSPCIGTGIN